MEDVEAKSGQGIGIVSAVVLTIDVIGLLLVGGFTLLANCMVPPGAAGTPESALQVIAFFLFSIPLGACAGIFLSLILILILKEIFIRAKTEKLVINLAVAAGLGGVVLLFIGEAMF